ncbi:AraC family transcriptional regulator [Pseudomonas caspiana]|uniref:AraC family transcriptional regulator n=1 Tax=Pseudomonas caspiana TaxID=1451454 RepID=UPI0032EC8A31
MQDRHTANDWVRHAAQPSKVGRFEAFFGAHAFEPHRHDTYAIGRTVCGVHRFSYRGEARLCMPGEIMIIHPDEPHDGWAGSEQGFRYQGIHVPPSLVQQIMQGKPLPFFKPGVSRDPRMAVVAEALLNNLIVQADSLAEDDALFNFVITLAQLAGQPTTRSSPHFAAALRAREYIDDNLDRLITLDDLAKCAERDRWSLSNDFRQFFGTSPHRYMTLRRLDRVRALTSRGQSLADAAIGAGFFDQSHMSRHFKKAFGVSPLRWCKSA